MLTALDRSFGRANLADCTRSAVPCQGEASHAASAQRNPLERLLLARRHVLPKPLSKTRDHSLRASCDFSYAGLKSAVRQLLETKLPPAKRATLGEAELHAELTSARLLASQAEDARLGLAAPLLPRAGAAHSRGVTQETGWGKWLPTSYQKLPKATKSY